MTIMQKQLDATGLSLMKLPLSKQQWWSCFVSDIQSNSGGAALSVALSGAALSVTAIFSLWLLLLHFEMSML